MSPAVRRFWIAAVGVAIGWTLLSAHLFPYDALGLTTETDRSRVWLLLLWTSGVMAICFGAAGLLEHGSPLGFRDVAAAGSLTQALQQRRGARRSGAPYHANFAWWLIVTGALLIVIYFVVWGIRHV